jgi:hypothetical protein
MFLVDLIRMMLQGASVVRFANTKLDAYKKKKNFVFVAIYIDSSGLSRSLPPLSG